MLLPQYGFVGMPSLDPGPQRKKHLSIHIGKGSFCYHMAVVVSPTAEFDVQLLDQLCRLIRRASLYQFPDVTQEAFYRCLGGLDEHLARVLTYVESEKIKAILDVRDTGFLFRELQTTFSKEAHYCGFDPCLQNFFRGSGDTEIISIANDIDLLAMRSCLAGNRFQSIQCHVRQSG